MTLVRLEKVSKSYGAHTVLDHVSWQVEEGDRIGLIGLNGCGKTTLFRLMMETLSPDSGTVIRKRGVRIGYLPQEPVLDGTRTVLQEILSAFQSLTAMQAELTRMESEMASDRHDEALLHRYGALLERYEAQGGYGIEREAKSVLSGLGLDEESQDRPVAVLSGGEKTRVALAKLLCGRPDLLLLDEPTNHLDIGATEWLEDFLTKYPGSVVVVSHDRYFLDRVVSEISELEDRGLQHYKGTYSEYAPEKARREAQKRKHYEEQQAEIARTEDFIQRNIAGQKTRQAQSRRKRLAKTERLAPPKGERNVRLHFTPERRGGNEVLVCEGLTKRYEDRTLFQDLTWTVRRGERLGIIGPNGTGKTTLLRMLLDHETPDAGTIRFGSHIHVGYYDQERLDLNVKHSVLEEVWAMDPRRPEGEMRTFLGAFLFSGDDVFKRIGSLSGGEQSRVSLCKLILSKANLLILDEPTNHLDIQSVAWLERFLKEYPGTVVAVTHDRYFLDNVAGWILELDRGHGIPWKGNYSSWLEQKEERLR
ncbi:MAG: ABC-F family ATP-binding cassette domain-containing protein, partial [Candidatus Latescibacteria bacterium]|nr:ABC-F family ATP-binding cassette domain-containing protein [Candidatus Latescibacterota bacterium]